MSNPEPPSPHQPTPDQQPTSPLEQQPPPPAATATPPPARASWFTGSRRTGIVAGVLGLVVGGVIGGSIGWAATGNDHENTREQAYSRQVERAQGPARGGEKQRARTRAVTIGTISAIDGSTWTLTGRGDRTITVTLAPTTKYGTAKAPQQASDFAVGDRVAVLGPDRGGKVTATRVAKRAERPAGSTPPASGSATPAPGTQPS